jgi:hypothetical protein
VFIEALESNPDATPRTEGTATEDTATTLKDHPTAPAKPQSDQSEKPLTSREKGL